MKELRSEPQAALLLRASQAIAGLEQRIAELEAAKHEPIAVLGIGCRLPGGADDPERLWSLLQDGVDAIRELPAERAALIGAGPGPALGGYIDDVERFDASFFGLSPRECSSLDPQHRLLLEVAWHALEDAGIRPSTLLGSATGVFVGMATHDYESVARERVSYEERGAYGVTGNGSCFAAGRLAYVLGVEGPTLTIDTACSSSLVAAHLAVCSLRLRECDTALVGGVNLMLDASTTASLAASQALAPDGRCKAFDAAANGFVRSEGCAVVVLKRLSDALASGDQIYALIRGSAVNQDGRSSGLTAPNVLSQQRLLRAALHDAQLTPSEVSFIETHGTGTALRDPIEIEALHAVYGEPRADQSRCFLGALKSNLGHLEAVSGLVGLIKAALVVERAVVPPNLHFKRLNPRIELGSAPFAFPAQSSAFSSTPAPRIAGVSSFGMSGTNAHLLLQEPPRSAPAERPSWQGPVIMPVSARSEAALARRMDALRAHVRDLDAVQRLRACDTAALHRDHLPVRRAVVAASAELLHEALLASQPSGREHSLDPQLCFVFTGQGSQYPGMGHALYATDEAFRAGVEACDAVLRERLGKTYLELTSGAEVRETRFAQPALFVLEYALCEAWRARGIVPAVVIGHSLGEITAACISGILSLPDALALVCERGRLMDALPERGTMASVAASAETVRTWIAPFAADVAIAAVNGPEQTVVSGRAAAIAQLVEQWTETGIECELLHVSHAFHSPLIDPALDAFEKFAAGLTFHAPSLPLISNVYGSLLGDRAFDSRYLRAHLRQPVEFSKGAATLAELGVDACVEIGPHPTLLAMLAPQLTAAVARVPSLRRGQPEPLEFLSGQARLYELGCEVRWAGHGAGFERGFPGYPFERERHWPAPRARRALASGEAASAPLAGTRVAMPGDGRHHVLFVGTAEQPYLADHVVDGELVVPAAFQLATTLACLRDAADSGGLRALHFSRRFTLSEAAAETHTLFSSSDDGTRTFQMAVRLADRDAWSVVATGELALDDGAWPSRLDVEAIRQRCARIDEPMHVLIARGGVALGPAFRWVAEAWASDTEALARIEQPRELQAIAPVHPVLIDAALQSAAAIMARRGLSGLPFRIERVRLRGDGVAAGYCHVRLREQVDADAAVFDVQLAAPGGEVLLDIEGCELRDARRSPEAEQRRVRELFLSESWEPVEESELEDTAQPLCLVLSEQAELGASLARALRAAGATVVGASAGDPAHSAELASALAMHPGRSVAVVYVPAADGGDGLVALPLKVSALIARLLQVTSWLGQRPLPGLRLWLLTQRAEATEASDVLDAFARSAQASMRVLAIERPEAGARTLDLPARFKPTDLARAAQVITSRVQEDRLAVRDGAVLACRAQPTRFASTASAEAGLAIRSEAFYVVSGAFGGLGQQVCRHLASRGARRLLLLGRDLDRPEARALLSELQQQGVSIEAAAVDVADREALARAFERTAGAAIAGVVHAAGVVEDALLEAVTPEQLARVFAPKLLGAHNLAELSGPALDFFVAFSSASVLFGSAAQAAYGAANAAMEAVVHRLSRTGVTALSIGWGAFAGAGMAARASESQRVWRQRGFSLLSPSDGMLALEQAIAFGAPHVNVLALDLERFVASFPGQELPSIARAFASAPVQLTAAANIRTQLEQVEPGRRAALFEQLLAESVRSTLRLQSLDGLALEQPLKEIGLDSLLAVELREQLATDLQLKLPSTLFFDHPSIRSAAGFLLERLVPAARSVQHNTQPISDETAAAEIARELAELQETK